MRLFSSAKIKSAQTKPAVRYSTPDHHGIMSKLILHVFLCGSLIISVVVVIDCEIKNGAPCLYLKVFCEVSVLFSCILDSLELIKSIVPILKPLKLILKCRIGLTIIMMIYL